MCHRILVVAAANLHNSTEYGWLDNKDSGTRHPQYKNTGITIYKYRCYKHEMKKC